MLVPILLSGVVLTALYASRSTSPRAETDRVKQFEVVVNASKYNSNAPGTVGKTERCANNPACDAQQALLDLGWTNPKYLGSDDPDLSRFHKEGRSVTFAFDVQGDLRADREVPPWMFYALRDTSPTSSARFS